MIAGATTMPVAIRDVISLAKPRLSALVVITCGGGMFMAPGRLDPVRAALTLAGTAAIVGAANALNCYLERDLDRHMSRTRDRPLPSGRMQPAVALWTALVLGAFALPTLVVFANALTAALAAFATVSYVVFYTPMKQRSPAALWVGAVPGAIPPLMGWTAVRGRLELPGIVLFAILFFWQIPHFIAIAMFRRDEYARAGHQVLTRFISDRAARVHIVFWSVLLFAITLAPVPLHLAGWLYGGVAVASGAAFLALAISGFVTRIAAEAWARRVFKGSLLYLTVLFSALMLSAR